MKRNIKESLGVPSLHWSLANLKKLGFNPSVAIDIGAYEGEWTKEVLEVFPHLKILMIEPQEAKRFHLQNFIRNNPKVHFQTALLSSTEGSEKLFMVNETASHIVSEDMEGFPVLRKKTETLDGILQKINFPLPDLLKLDVQGHEPEILIGGREALAHAEICILEISLLNLDGQTPLLEEMVALCPKEISRFTTFRG